jgi:hypothetical protein
MATARLGRDDDLDAGLTGDWPQGGVPVDEIIPDESDQRRPGRRAVIKGAAAGVVGVWAVPVVTSFTSPAHAGDSAGNPNPECRGANCATFIPCSSENGDCVCTTTSTGGGFCVPGSTPCAGLTPCDNGNCPAGSVCVVDTCCGTPLCAPIELNKECPPSAAGAKASGARKSSGAGTIGG